MVEHFNKYVKNTDRLNIRFCGQGGQGVILLAYLYGKAAVLQGMNAVQTQQYGPESRGSPVKSDLVVSNSSIKFPQFKVIDVLIAMTRETYEQNHYKVNASGLIFVDSSLVKSVHEQPNCYGIPATDLAEKKFGNKMVSNILLLGYANKIMNSYLKEEYLITSIEESVRKQFVEKNIEAFKFGSNWQEQKETQVPIEEKQQ